ncbi:MAG TPA: hypothetical protein DCW83_08370 [Saprospirales bacterium]|jgi:hypothetical protein|nr:hypothetical protein [Saprospirales bacterium]
MATSVYFNGAVRSEQDLYEDLVLESIKMFGQDVVYIPREQIYEDALLNETLNQYRHAFPIECFIENVEGFEGDGNLLSKFGLEIRDQGNFVIPAKRWDHVVGMNLASDLGHQSLSKPGEGDLIYMPMTDRIFEIKYVEPKNPFYQLADLPTYTLTAELFEYNDQNFDTGMPEIDNIELLYASAYSYTTTATANTNHFEIGEYVHQYTGSTDGGGTNINIIGKIAGYEAVDTETYTVTIVSPHQSTNGDGTFMQHAVHATRLLVGQTSGSSRQITVDLTGTTKTEYNRDPYADNDEFEFVGDDVIDFSESNPFGDP